MDYTKHTVESGEPLTMVKREVVCCRISSEKICPDRRFPLALCEEAPTLSYLIDERRGWFT
jgi:hypothetical protein